MERLKDKVAVVTGSASGNGTSIAKKFLKEGAKVVFADINEAALTEVTEGLRGNFLTVKTDVSRQESVREMIYAAIHAFGRVDIMVANAGVTLRKHFLELTEADYDHVMDINAKGVFFCSQEAARVMVDNGGGSIIHMSSITASVAEPNAVQYGASKGAVASMTRHMAMDLGEYGIRVNAIAPGTIRTGFTTERLEQQDIERQEADLTLLKRVGETEDLVGAALLLASDESSFMTGTHITVDGGYTIK